jgi:hypothetical protein
MKTRYLFLSLLAATALPIARADADPVPILHFAQTSGADTVTATNPAGGGTTILDTTPVDITQILASPPLPVPILATLTLSAHSTGGAITFGGQIIQAFTGSFSIIGGGINYLSGSFTDVVDGPFLGNSLSLVVSNSAVPPEIVDFTSDVIKDLNSPRSLTLAFTAVTPAAFIIPSATGNTIRGFNAAVAGNMSATIPEPSTWAMMLVGFAGLGYAAFRSRRRATSFV